jgi:prolipoprotein diacylglyceryltransferase
LAAFGRLRSREGQVFALLAIVYPVTRFMEELIRNDNPHDVWHGVWTHNQVTSLVLLMGGVIMLAWLRRAAPSAGPAWAQRLAAVSPGRNSRRQETAPSGQNRKRS